MTTQNRLIAAVAIVWCLAPLTTAFAQAPVATAPTMITDADIKAVATPSADDKAKGDPAGTITGTAADIPRADPAAGLTIADVVTEMEIRHGHHAELRDDAIAHADFPMVQKATPFSYKETMAFTTIPLPFNKESATIIL